MAATHKNSHRGTPAGEAAPKGQFVPGGQIGLMAPWPSRSMIAVFQLLRENMVWHSDCLTEGHASFVDALVDSQERCKCDAR
jgi:hypothetical protein